MRVGMFTYGMSGALTGIGRYAVELTRALRRLEPSLELVLLTPYPQSPHPWYREFESYPLPELCRLPAVVSLGNWALHRAALKLELDILHDPCGIAPFLLPTRRYRRVTTVHDAVPFIYPHTQPLLTRLTFQTLVRAARFTADAVLTDSASAAHDLAHHAGIPAHKLVAVPLGTERPPPRQELEVAAALAQLRVTSPYFLYVGALHPRKNLARVVAAFSQLRAETAAAHLVVVGPPSWGADHVFKQLQASSHQDSGVLLTGFVSDEALHALYYGARALVFPSLYEGFGLPALEAMAHGTPVIGANTSSLPEVIGEAGLLVDPLRTDEIAVAMRRLLHDEALHRDLSSRSRCRAQQFSWARTAQLTLEVYQRVL